MAACADDSLGNSETPRPEPTLRMPRKQTPLPVANGTARFMRAKKRPALDLGGYRHKTPVKKIVSRPLCAVALALPPRKQAVLRFRSLETLAPAPKRRAGARGSGRTEGLMKKHRRGMPPSIVLPSSIKASRLKRPRRNRVPVTMRAALRGLHFPPRQTRLPPARDFTDAKIQFNLRRRMDRLHKRNDAKAEAAATRALWREVADLAERRRQALAGDKEQRRQAREERAALRPTPRATDPPKNGR